MKAAVVHDQIREWNVNFRSCWRTLTMGSTILSHTIKRTIRSFCDTLGPRIDVCRIALAKRSLRWVRSTRTIDGKKV